jgi:hypothetical protein
MIAAGGQRLIGDPACFLFFDKGQWIGFVMVHVDDIIPGGTPEFNEMIMTTLRTQFKISKDQVRKFTYIGMALRSEGTNIFMNQTQYIEELEDIPVGMEDNMSEDKLKAFLRQVVGKLLYLNLSRPDLAFKVNSLAKVTSNTDLKEKVKEARSLIKEIKSTQLEIKYSRLGDLNDLYLEVYADAAFGNQDEKTKSTEGSIIMLRGQGSKCAPISWKSKTLARVCKSAKTAETMAMENAADTAIGLGRQLYQI